MKKSLTHWQIAGFFFVSVVGTLLHFLFEWSGEGRLVALIAPVNESIWEHMKLVLWPMAVFALVEYRSIGKEIGRFWCAKLKGLLTALLLIPAIYYLYTGALGQHWMSHPGKALPNSQQSRGGDDGAAADPVCRGYLPAAPDSPFPGPYDRNVRLPGVSFPKEAFPWT